MQKLLTTCPNSTASLPLRSECSPQVAQIERAVNQHVLTKLAEKAKGETAWFDPATMTPWMEDYYYGRKIR